VIASLDGYIEDEFDWAAPDEDVQGFFNDLERGIGTYLDGRRMYETMPFWENPPALEAQPAHVREFAQLWQAAESIVNSSPIEAGASGGPRIEREFDPEAVRELKAAAHSDLTVGGPELAAQAIEAGLVDELQLFPVPVLVGGGKRSLPHGGARVDLELLDGHRFAGGTVFLRYRTGTAR